MRMTDVLEDIYTPRLLELAARTPNLARLPSPDGTATAHSKLCGSVVSVDLGLREDGAVARFGQDVKACLLGQASASVVGREIVGTGEAELRRVADEMRRMLKENGAPPSGRWSDLALLQSVRDYRARHASTLLVFDAIEAAFDDARARAGAAHG
jgi:NifU-like protein involved in Fe-S cluster formation